MQKRASTLELSASLRQHHDRAYAIISKGLDLEERGSVQQALEHYQSGLKELTAALRFDGPRELQRKMKATQKAVEERVQELTRSKPKAPRVKGQYLKGIDAKLANTILNDVLVERADVSWDDVVGLTFAKQILKETIILPSLRPELFTGLRSPVKGILLFGPPGTGKTLLAKAVAHESRSTFFSISASSLTSKYVGESEKLVKALFATARELQPSIIFIDEIDSILISRGDTEHEASRRLKTEFLLQFDGVASTTDERVLVVGATNRPQELDDAAIRRFPKRVYIPLPDAAIRTELFQSLLKGQSHTLTRQQMARLVELTEGYSGSDITALAREAALEPLRALGDRILNAPIADVRPISFDDFKHAITVVRPSVPAQAVQEFEAWNNKHGKVGTYLSRVTIIAKRKSLGCRQLQTIRRLNEVFYTSYAEGLFLDVCANGTPDEVRQVLEAHPRLEIKRLRTPRLQTPLHLVCKRSDVHMGDLVALLLDAGMDVREVLGDAHGWSALDYAILRKHARAAYLLIKAGADISKEHPYRLLVFKIAKQGMDRATARVTAGHYLTSKARIELASEDVRLLTLLVELCIHHIHSCSVRQADSTGTDTHGLSPQLLRLDNLVVSTSTSTPIQPTISHQATHQADNVNKDMDTILQDFEHLHVAAYDKIDDLQVLMDRVKHLEM